jgi:L-alanine-DL-glutamate epimerase-like enolase superfamily enzyme
MMRFTRVSMAVVQGNFPWVLGDGEPPIRDGYILLGDAPGHGMNLNEDVARAHLKPGISFFGDTP